MPALPTFQARRFGPAASTITLATKGGAVLGGVWISARGTAPTFVAYDAVASVTGSDIIPSTAVPAAALGTAQNVNIECGTGLTVKVASCSGTIFWRPSSAGV
jgi:hypothetical protein